MLSMIKAFRSKLDLPENASRQYGKDEEAASNPLIKPALKLSQTKTSVLLPHFAIFCFAVVIPIIMMAADFTYIMSPTYEGLQEAYDQYMINMSFTLLISWMSPLIFVFLVATGKLRLTTYQTENFHFLCNIFFTIMGFSLYCLVLFASCYEKEVVPYYNFDSSSNGYACWKNMIQSMSNHEVRHPTHTTLDHYFSQDASCDTSTIQPEVLGVYFDDLMKARMRNYNITSLIIILMVHLGLRVLALVAISSRHFPWEVINSSDVLMPHVSEAQRKDCVLLRKWIIDAAARANSYHEAPPVSGIPRYLSVYRTNYFLCGAFIALFYTALSAYTTGASRQNSEYVEKLGVYIYGGSFWEVAAAYDGWYFVVLSLGLLGYIHEFWVGLGVAYHEAKRLQLNNYYIVKLLRHLIDGSNSLESDLCREVELVAMRRWILNGRLTHWLNVRECLINYFLFSNHLRGELGIVGILCTPMAMLLQTVIIFFWTGFFGNGVFGLYSVGVCIVLVPFSIELMLYPYYVFTIQTAHTNCLVEMADRHKIFLSTAKNASQDSELKREISLVKLTEEVSTSAPLSDSFITYEADFCYLTEGDRARQISDLIKSTDEPYRIFGVSITLTAIYGVLSYFFTTICTIAFAIAMN